jgi:hypothetical protein
MREIYRKYGWPDVEKYRKEACIQALKLWYQDREVRQIKKMQIETRLHWERQGIIFPESSETDDIWRRKVEDEIVVTEPEGEN